MVHNYANGHDRKRQSKGEGDCVRDPDAWVVMGNLKVYSPRLGGREGRRYAEVLGGAAC